MPLRVVLAAVLLCVGAQAQSGWKMVWHDEFDGASLDPAKWVYETGVGTPAGWGNHELEYYTDSTRNVRVENGVLIVEARKETAPNGSSPYTSGRIKTQAKFSQAYGRFEARIKIPAGQGIWPAFWMLGDNVGEVGWPRCGEIDIMENIGKEPATVHATVHGPGYSGANGIGAAYSLATGPFADDFHEFAAEWEPEKIRFYADGHLYHTMTKSMLPAGTAWVFDHPFFLLLNVAVGGDWPGYPDASSSFPQSMQVDYVRVYTRPAIMQDGKGVVSSASFEAGLAPGSWVTIRGTGLAIHTREWRGEDFVDGQPPTELDGTSVTIEGKPAFVAYISPTQINAQAPEVAAGEVRVVVMNNGVASEPVTARAQVYQPALFAWGKYVVALRADYSAVGPSELYPGVTTPARRREIVILWGTGFGPVEPAFPAGRFVTGVSRIVDEPIITIGGLAAEYLHGELTPMCIGLYQIATKIPEAAPEGDLPVVLRVAGYHTQPALFLRVQGSL